MLHYEPIFSCTCTPTWCHARSSPDAIMIMIMVQMKMNKNQKMMMTRMMTKMMIFLIMMMMMMMMMMMTMMMVMILARTTWRYSDAIYSRRPPCDALVGARSERRLPPFTGVSPGYPSQSIPSWGLDDQGISRANHCTCHELFHVLSDVMEVAWLVAFGPSVSPCMANSHLRYPANWLLNTPWI